MSVQNIKTGYINPWESQNEITEDVSTPTGESDGIQDGLPPPKPFQEVDSPLDFMGFMQENSAKIGNDCKNRVNRLSNKHA